MNLFLQTQHYLSRNMKIAGAPLIMSLILSGTTYASNHDVSLTKTVSHSKFANAIRVTGIVKDNKGEPLPGVSVKIKGTTTAVSTDINGAFRIDLPSGNETLVFTFLGFKTKEVVASGKTNFTVVLEESISTLDEVVVIGYGTVKRRDLTGSVASVKGEDIASNPVSNPMEALQGRVAGLDIQRTDGSSGSAPNVLLRGNRSISATQNPLYIIDGIPGDITSLNPNDIESIDVMKDASSTAIYGSAGANGVVIVTTKKGTVGKVQIDVDSYYGVNQLSSFPKPLMGDAWIQYQQDKYFSTNGSYAASLSDLNISSAAITAINAGQWLDWTEETFQTGSQQNHHVSIRGGSEKTQAYLSLGSITEEGIYKNDKSQFYNSRAGVDVKFSKLFKAGIQTTLNWKETDRTNSRVNKAYGIYPLGTAYAEDGTIRLNPIDGDPTVSAIANYAPGVLVNNSKNFYLAVNPYVEITPVKNLSIRSNFGTTLSSNRNGIFQNERSYNLAVEGKTQKEASYGTNLGYGYIWENIANYNFSIQKDHNITLTGITSWTDSRREASFIGGDGLDYDDFLYYNMGSLKNITSKSSSFYGTNKLSFAGRVNYSYKGKYLLTFSNRWDGASQLVQRWSAFPSVAGAWRVSDEKFMSSTRDWLNNMKVRVGYGISGTANIDAYQTSTEVTSRNVNMSLGGSAILPIYVMKQALGNTDITWEKAYNTNVGLELSFLKSRFDVNLDWYHTNTKGVLWVRKMPTTSGGLDAKNPYTKLSNIADTENQGLELALSSRNIIKKDFKWNTALTFTRAKEKLTSIDLGSNIKVEDLISENLFIGSPVGTLYGYKKIGVWQLGEEQEALKYGAKPGDIKLQTVEMFDANGVSDNGVHPYSAKDKMILGHTNPDWTMGMQNSFVYKSFDLGVFMTMRYGQMIDADVLGHYNSVAQPATYNYWTPSNPTNDYPQPITGTGINTTYQSALNFVDGSYFKIKNVTLGYTIPKNALSKVGLSRARIYGTAYNPLIFAKSKLLKDVDPETGGSDQFPLFKQFVFGVNLSF